LLRFQISLLPKIFPKKKTAAFCVFCGLRYSSDNLLSFDTNALYFVRPLYLRNRSFLILSQVLTTEQIVSHMVDCIKEVNTVVQIPTTTVRSVSLSFKSSSWIENSPNMPKDHALFFAANTSLMGSIPVLWNRSRNWNRNRRNKFLP
jgi:hypothetical protein